MGRDHRRPDVLVTEQFLHGTDVIPRFEYMGGKGMPQGMTTRCFGELCLPDSRPHRPLQDQWVDVMPPDDARPRVPRRLRGRKDIWPCPLATRIGVFALQYIGRVDVPSACLHILHMKLLDIVEMPLQGRFDLLGQHCHPVPAAFAVTHDYVIVGAVDIFHPPHAD